MRFLILSKISSVADKTETLGLLIPPSLSLLIYGALTETSIGKLFMGGILPGILMAILFMLYIFIRSIKNPK